MLIKNKYDTAVIGGGPAGMIAAISSSINGHKTILLEKNNQLGKKLLITGKGRCNITHNTESIKKFIELLDNRCKFLYPALNEFGIEDTINFFEKKGLKTISERGNRIFPQDGNANDVLNILIEYLKESKTDIKTNLPVKKIITSGNKIEKLSCIDQYIYAENFILCTGGLSFPQTGSTGDGINFAGKFGHKIINPLPALVPLKIKEKWINCLTGLDIKNIKISVYQNNKKLFDSFGEASFIKNGIGGPIVLDMSRKIGDLMKSGEITLKLDLKPALDFKKLDARILRDFNDIKNKTFKNSLNKLLPQKLIPVILDLSGIDKEKKINTITKIERKKVLYLLKELTITVSSLFGFEKAIITAGGIDLKEIHPKSMKSKKIDNLYFAGEIIDLDAPTGGFNLQICWSTGYLAGIQK